MPIGDIGTLYDTDEVLVGSAAGFIAPVGTDDPDDSITVFDPLVWVSPWIPAGATEQGWQVNWTPQTSDIRIDEQPTPVDEQMDTAVLQFVANLSQDATQQWQWALNADKTVVAAGLTTMGKTVLTPSGTLKKYKVVLETQNEGDMPRRYIVPKMTAAANVGASFKRSGTQRLIPITFSAVCKLSDIQIVDITSDHT